ncbi:MAG TPA: retropepsin-like aspartic protease, partial [Gemmatimonadaceae bacterium]|nr:retropepsin-like aspartic protease [Gemmatimonadaceae bacterium]
MPVQENDFASLYSDTFWAALADLQLSALRDAARSTAEVGFAEGVAMLAAGDHQRAESTFVATTAQEVDLYVAVASHIMLATTLAYEHKWAALRDLSNNSRLAAVDRGSTAVLERWGRAFAGVDERITTFAQQHVTLPLRLTAIGTPTVHVRINGKEYDFWLDTGSTMTVLSSDVAKDANVSVISEDTLTVRTFAGTAPVKA